MAASKPGLKPNLKPTTRKVKAPPRTSKPKKPAATSAGNQLRTPRSTFTSSRSLLLMLVFVAVVLAVCGAAIVHHRQVAEQARKTAALNADKAAFARLEKDMQSAYDAIVAQVGEPASHNYDRGCGRPDLKYAEGQLFCNVDLNFGYKKVIDSEKLNAKIVQQISKSGFLLVNTNDEKASESILREYQFTKGRFNCRLIKFKTTTKKVPFEGFKFRCGSDLAEPVYPLAQ